MDKNEAIVIIEVENFECAKNIAVGSDQFVPCLAQNRYLLTIDPAKRIILWGGEGCRHYNAKIGQEVSPITAISFFKTSKGKEELKIKQAQRNIDKIDRAFAIVKKWDKE